MYGNNWVPQEGDGQNFHNFHFAQDDPKYIEKDSFWVGDGAPRERRANISKFLFCSRRPSIQPKIKMGEGQKFQAVGQQKN